VLSQRFEIQDIVAQDLLGVTFHALEVASGKNVLLRRFFPFGVDGGGLFDEERTGYDIAVARLAGLKHPGLRAILAGGCDPVDGMPFVVIEWIAGKTLDTLRQHENFTPAAVTDVLERALEISEALSRVLGEEAVWVETAPSMILADSAEPACGFFFCLSPMKWLGGDDSQRSLLALAELTEDLLGWRGKLVAEHAGNGLGLWVKWLRANAQTCSLFEARVGLASCTGRPAPVSTTRAGAQTPDPATPDPATPDPATPDPATPDPATPDPARSNPARSSPARSNPARSSPARSNPPIQPAVPVVREGASSRQTWILIGALILLVMGAGWWSVRQSRNLQEAAPSAATPAIPRDAAGDRLAQINTRAAALVENRPRPAVSGRIFQSGEGSLLMNEKGQEVTVEGILLNIRTSNSGKTLYLEFADSGTQEEVRGCFLAKNLPDDVSEQTLKPLVGKRIRITGVVRIEHASKQKWPEVLLNDRQAVKQMN
jgi:hypothetical protein